MHTDNGVKKVGILNEDMYFSNKLYVLQFVYALLVIMIHAYNTYAPPCSPCNTLQVFFGQNLPRVAVPSFFAVSAYFFYRKFSWGMLGKRWHSRIKSILLPYLAWNTIWFVLMYASYIVMHKQPVLSVQDVVGAVFLHTYNGVFWYMGQMILYVALCPIIYALLRNRYSASAVLAVLIVLCVCNVTIPVIRLDSFVFYFFGAFIGLHYPQLVTKRSTVSLRAVAGVAVIAALAVWYIPFSAGNWDVPERFLLVCGFFILADSVRLPQAGTTMKMTFFIYSIHNPIAQLFKKLFYTFLPKADLFFLLNLVCTFLLTAIASILAGRLLKRYMKRTYMFLSGGR